MNKNIAEELKMKNNSVTLFLNVLTVLLFFILKIIFYSIIPLEFIHRVTATSQRWLMKVFIQDPFGFPSMSCFASSLSYSTYRAGVWSKKSKGAAATEAAHFYDPCACKILKKGEEFI